MCPLPSAFCRSRLLLASFAFLLRMPLAATVGSERELAVRPRASDELPALASQTPTLSRRSQPPSLRKPRDLAEFPQWREEVGYWIGELSFYGSDGSPNKSGAWNYPYDKYRAFITGNISGGSYRQRNVFLYPPQTADACSEIDSVVGDGACGENGNSKVFEADQTTPENSSDGTVEGPWSYAPGFEVDTKTTLVGEGDSVLYQVYFQGSLIMNQLTTLSGDGHRTRTAHGFAPGSPVPQTCSFYRERRVGRDEFYAQFEATIDEYRILEGDLCSRNGVGAPIDGASGGLGACVAHLEESFQLGMDAKKDPIHNSTNSVDFRMTDSLNLTAN